MSDSPLISVGIPTYNRPEGLRNTLARITGQTYANLEIVVSDNCSSDESAVRAVVDEFRARDPRVKFFRQKTNLGSIGNFRFLVGEATGRYFLWAADDDEVEKNYVEVLKRTLESTPGAAIAMTDYDVIDTMTNPPIHVDLGRHLHGLRGATAFDRLKKYVKQPDHLGKSRIVWGIFAREELLSAFDACLEQAKGAPTLGWADLPVDFRMLAQGDIGIAPEKLFHVHLLPTSDGRQGLAHRLPKLLGTAERWARACASVVRDTTLSAQEKATLQSLIRRKCRRDKVQLFVYYGIIGRFPRLARAVKKLWYRFA